uniref:Bidirectional sugar transporter SWEET n=1 Tax=Musa acuminata subsp. malaccensis TaxID=214687 RepID=A0A804L5Q5_MUSAM
MEVVRFVFGIFGNATALFLFLSPLVTFQRIIRKRSTEDFSGVPYTMTLLNCLLSAWYGLPFVSPNNLLVSTINGAGSVIEAVYVLIFLVFAPKKERARVAALFTFVLSVFAVIALVSLLALRGQRRKIFCGFAAAIFSICMYASPLSIMVRSLDHLPLLGLHEVPVRDGSIWASQSNLRAEIGDQDQKRGVHAVSAVLVRVLVRDIMVRLWLTGWGSIRHGAEWVWERAGSHPADPVCNLQESHHHRRGLGDERPGTQAAGG